MRIVKNAIGKVQTIYMKMEEFQHDNESFLGVCVECGSTQGQCEPDLRNGTCAVCCEPGVFGLEELLHEEKLEVST